MNSRPESDELRDRDWTRDGEQIEPHQYCELALSNRRIERCNIPSQGIIGLRDSQTGRRYWIDEQSLLQADLRRLRHTDA